MVYILTGNIQTGKSYALNEWIKNKPLVVGLLSITDKEGKRYFLDIRNKKTFSMHANESENEDNKIYVGRFIFSTSAFKSANSIIQFEAQQTDYSHFIVDELGKLELNRQGLYSSTHKLVKTFEDKTEKHLILVVRSALLEDVFNHYHLKTYKILYKDNLNFI
jgi:nucleoside-triphosphatase